MSATPPWYRASFYWKGVRVRYAANHRLWKVKHVPTIDFAVYRAFDNVFELMLRSKQACIARCRPAPASATVQSLHQFRDGSYAYTLPVLLADPSAHL